MSEKESQVSKEKVPPCQVTFTMDGSTRKGTSTHFHDSGMLVICRHPAPLNARLRLSIVFHGFKNPVELDAEVVWSNIHGPADSVCPRAMGVRFLNLERDVERLLGEQSARYDPVGPNYSCYYT